MNRVVLFTLVAAGCSSRVPDECRLGDVSCDGNVSLVCHEVTHDGETGPKLWLRDDCTAKGKVCVLLTVEAQVQPFPYCVLSATPDPACVGERDGFWTCNDGKTVRCVGGYRSDETICEGVCHVDAACNDRPFCVSSTAKEPRCKDPVYFYTRGGTVAFCNGAIVETCVCGYTVPKACSHECVSTHDEMDNADAYCK